MRKIAPRRELGTFSSQQAQIQGQDAARSVNDAKQRLDDLILLVLAQSFTTDVTALLLTKLSFRVKKGDLWFIEYWGTSHCSSTNGVNLGLAVPPNSVLAGTLESSSSTTAVGAWFITQITTAAIAPIAACHVGANDNGRPDRIQCRIECLSDGVIGLTAGSVTAGTLSTIDARAILRASRYTKVFP